MVTFVGRETQVDLVVLDMVHLDIILGIDWLALYHAILDSYTKIMTLVMNCMPIAWKGILHLCLKGDISFLCTSCIIERRCLSYLSYVCDTTIVTTSNRYYLGCSQIHGNISYGFSYYASRS